MAHIVRATANPPGADSRGDEVTIRVERRLHDAARGHAVVATLGQRALAVTDFSLLLNTIAMPIPGHSRPYGLLIIGARHDRIYSREDRFFIAGFLQKTFTPATLVRTIQDAVRCRAKERV